MVQDPKKEKQSGQDRVAELLERARAAGALDGDAADLGAASERTSFPGGARTLSGKAPPPAAPAAPAAPAPVVHTIVFYHNGFTVNGGPLRRLDDPANEPFMSAIAKGHAPQELLPPSPLTPININLVRKDEDWVAPPEPKYTAFGGGGNRLGGPAEGGPAAAPPSQPLAAGVAWEVDELKPITSLRLRLLDGTVVTARFNTHMKLAHVRAFIESVRPGTGSLGLLQSGMPPRPVDESDGAATLESLGLLASALTQK